MWLPGISGGEAKRPVGRGEGRGPGGVARLDPRGGDPNGAGHDTYAQRRGLTKGELRQKEMAEAVEELRWNG